MQSRFELAITKGLTPLVGREMLTEIYGWFTEGFETADLKGKGAVGGAVIKFNSIRMGILYFTLRIIFGNFR